MKERFVIGCAIAKCNAPQARKGKPRKYNPSCTNVQHFYEKALLNEYNKRKNEYIHVRTTEELLLYFPLFDQNELSDFVCRTAGDVCLKTQVEEITEE